MPKSDNLLILMERLARVVLNESQTEGLKPAQWEALRYLARANRFSRTPTALTAYLGITKGTVSQTLIALERKGLVAKAVDPGDRRQVRTDVTAKGARLLVRDPIGAIAKAATGLTGQERHHLNDALEVLLREILRSRGGQPFGVCKTCRFFRRNAKEGAPHYCGLLDEPLTKNDSEQICIEQEAPAA